MTTTEQQLPRLIQALTLLTALTVVNVFFQEATGAEYLSQVLRAALGVALNVAAMLSLRQWLVSVEKRDGGGISRRQHWAVWIWQAQPWTAVALLVTEAVIYLAQHHWSVPAVPANYPLWLLALVGLFGALVLLAWWFFVQAVCGWIRAASARLTVGTPISFSATQRLQAWLSTTIVLAVLGMVGDFVTGLTGLLTTGRLSLTLIGTVISLVGWVALNFVARRAKNVVSSMQEGQIGPVSPLATS